MNINYEDQHAKEALKKQQETFNQKNLKKIKNQERYKMTYLLIEIVSLFLFSISYFVGSTNNMLFFRIIYLVTCIKSQK
jgi:hypothetical protein